MENAESREIKFIKSSGGAVEKVVTYKASRNIWTCLLGVKEFSKHEECRVVLCCGSIILFSSEVVDWRGAKYRDVETAVDG